MAQSKEEVAAQKRAYYHANKERLTAKREEWRKANPTVWAERQQRQRAKHVESARERARIWYANNKTTVLPHLKAKRLALRAKMVAAYGGRCICCGETNARFLTIDHINGGGGKHRKSLGGGEKITLHLKKMGWPQDGYQLLCYNCNCGRAHNGGICPHVDPVSTV